MRELSLHILDLVQNSVEAGATKIQLAIYENLQEDDLSIVICDNGKGMNKELCQRVCDPFVTTRVTRKVGLGLPLIKMSAERCGGFLKIDSQPNVGTTITVKFQYCHWDRPPLGNIAQTIKVIMVSNYNKIDFSYTHKINDKIFQMSSGEMKQILGDVSILHPEVLGWLEEYLRAGLSNLYGGIKNENS